jgi:glycosyltransferase involved in cell wall biosynthesis
MSKNVFEPLVSIIIPVFNGKDYLEESICSAINQDYENVEIIVINDGSTDGGETQKIIDKYSNKIVSINQVNQGVAAALNVGIRKSSGDYISWLSHDDVYLKNKISNQINFLRDIENKNVILYSKYVEINSKGQFIRNNLDDRNINQERFQWGLYPLITSLIGGCTLLLPREVFNNNFFNEKLRHTQDYDLWFNIFKNRDVIFDNLIGTKVRIHDKQNSKNFNESIEENDKLWISFITGTKSHDIKDKITDLQISAIFYNHLRKSVYKESKKFAKNYFYNMYDKNTSKFKNEKFSIYDNRIVIGKELNILAEKECNDNQLRELLLMYFDLCQRYESNINVRGRIEYFKNGRKVKVRYKIVSRETSNKTRGHSTLIKWINGQKYIMKKVNYNVK